MKYTTKEMQQPYQPSDSDVYVEWTSKDGVTHSNRLSIDRAQIYLDTTDMTEEPLVYRRAKGVVIKIFVKEDK